MPVAYNKFEIFVLDLAEKKHDLSADLLELYLSNIAPAVTNDIKADIAEITLENGYVGAVDTQNTGAEATGTYTLTGTKVVVTAAAGTVGPFQYAILFNETQTTPVDPLISWWDRGSALTLQDGESFSVKFNSSETTGSILTIA